MKTRLTMICAALAVLAASACGPNDRNRDAGRPGIDANLPSVDAAVTACSTTGPENTAEACSDACDNDGNGFVDCNDFGCCSVVTCGADTACGRRGDAGVRADAFVPACPTMGDENTTGACSDGCDNDGDGFADCDDFDCCSRVTCGPSTACGRRGDGGVRSDAAVMACATAGPESSADACSDGCDNDGNGYYDCGDRNCCRYRSDCGASTYCGRLENTCATVGDENTAGACSDGCDNDRNGFADCEDAACCGVRSDCASTTYCGSH